MSDKPRVIFDTTCITQAAISPRGPAETQAVSLMEEGRVEVFMSNRLRSEYEKTLVGVMRSERFKHMTPDFVIAHLDRFDRQANRILNPPYYAEYVRDRDDEDVLNLAIHIEANYIVSKDKDLLDLAHDPEWTLNFPGIKIVSPEELRHQLTKQQRPAPAREPDMEPEL